MLERLLALLIFTAIFGLIARLWYGVRLKRIARDRLTEGLVELEEPEEEVEVEPAAARPFLRRHHLAPWIAGAGVAALVYVVVGLQGFYAVMFGSVVGIIVYESESFLADQQTMRIEVQLADAIDLMVASLRAGAGMLNCLEMAVQESRPPLRAQLDEVLGRIRYGDDPHAVFRGLTARVPLETFRLFASALAVHSEVGGSLAPTLATVGRIIRDRIELSRRIRSLTVQSRASVFAILGTSYFIALVMWLTDPPRMEAFLSNPIGGALFSGVIILQVIGIFWSSAWSRLKY